MKNIIYYFIIYMYQYVLYYYIRSYVERNVEEAINVKKASSKTKDLIVDVNHKKMDEKKVLNDFRKVSLY